MKKHFIKIFIKIFIGVVIAVFALGYYGHYSNQQRQKTVFSYDFHEGKSFSLQKEQHQFVEALEGATAGARDLIKSKFLTDFTVTAVDADGTASIQAYIRDYEMIKTSNNSPKEVTALGRTDEFSVILSKLMQQKYNLKVSAQGKILGVTNFDDVIESFYGSLDNGMIDTPEKVYMLEGMIALFVGTKETAGSNLFGGYFPVLSGKNLSPLETWQNTETISNPAYDMDLTTTYTYQGLRDGSYSDDITFSEHMGTPKPHGGNMEITFSEQGSFGTIEYDRSMGLPVAQEHRSGYKMSHVLLENGERQPVAKVKVMSQRRVLPGDRLDMGEIDDIMQVIDMQKEVESIVDDVNKDLNSMSQSLMTPEQAEQMMRNMETLGKSIQQERQFRDFMRNAEFPPAKEDAREE